MALLQKNEMLQLVLQCVHCMFLAYVYHNPIHYCNYYIAGLPLTRH